MDLGLLPAMGSGIAELRRTGQVSRFVDGYLAPYSGAFERVTYFSYLPESLDDYTEDPMLLARARVIAPRRRRPRLLRALDMPLRHRRELRRCAVLRVFQVTGAIPALVARARWGTPFVTSYGFWYARLSRPGLSRPAKRILERVALRRAAAVIVPAVDLAAHVASIAPRERIHLIPNGVDVSRFKPRGRRETPAREIVYVGRLSEEKNLSALVRAVAMLAPPAGGPAGRRAARLVMVGDGPQRAALEGEARACGVDLELAGVVDHARVPEWLERADVFALPSFTEGHPKALIEAMAAGLPCVVSDCAGNRAVVQDGVTGLLFDPGDAAALAARLERVLADDAFGAALGDRARLAAAREFDLRRLVDREIALLTRVSRESGR